MNPLRVFAQLALLSDAFRTSEATGIAELRVLVNPAGCCVWSGKNILAPGRKVNRVSEYDPGAYPFKKNEGPKNRTLTPFAGRTR